ncbi:hypothetical protein WME91_07285 [Sorangium sp. So ce269]
MAGYPKASNADRTENPSIKVLGFDDCAGTGRVEGQWGIAAPPLHANSRRYASTTRRAPRSAPASARAGCGDAAAAVEAARDSPVGSWPQARETAPRAEEHRAREEVSSAESAAPSSAPVELGAGDDAGHAELSRLLTGSPRSITTVSSASAR